VCELNYSSDIDLLFLFGDGRESTAAEISSREYFVRLAQQVTEILSRPTAEGAVFRIDLRLRPQGNEGELAISLANALQYYVATAHDWERQALIKARHSAGNEALAREFTRRIQPQVYQTKVNFTDQTALVTGKRLTPAQRAIPHSDVKIDRRLASGTVGFWCNVCSMFTAGRSHGYARVGRCSLRNCMTNATSAVRFS
jgi:glutamate-ammonia-ligase adenylyltransferase